MSDEEVFVQLISTLNRLPVNAGTNEFGPIGGYLLNEDTLGSNDIIGGSFSLYDPSAQTHLLGSAQVQPVGDDAATPPPIPLSVIDGNPGISDPGVSLQYSVSPGVNDLAIKTSLSTPSPFVEHDNAPTGFPVYLGEANVISIADGPTISVGYGLHNLVLEARENPEESLDVAFTQLANSFLQLQAFAPDDASLDSFVDGLVDFVREVRTLDKGNLQDDRDHAQFYLDGFIRSTLFTSLTFSPELDAAIASLREPISILGDLYIDLIHTPMMSIDGKLYRQFDEVDYPSSFKTIADIGDETLSWDTFGVDYAKAINNAPGTYGRDVNAWSELYYISSTVMGPIDLAVVKEYTNVEAYIQAGSFRTSLADVKATGPADIIGSEMDDDLSGTFAPDNIRGRDGDDKLRGGAGNDRLFGEAGNDTFFGGDGDDSFFGGEGFDIVSYLQAEQGVNVYLQFSGARTGQGRDNFDSIEGIIGSNFDDRLIGDEGFNTFFGGAGDDVIKTKGGDDEAKGREGNDRLIGDDNGNERLLGGFGDDIILGFAGDDYLSGNQGNDFVYGGRGNDTVLGGFDDDVLRGNLNNDTLFGGDGLDRLFGGGQNDRLFGDAGRDFLLGENGNDELDGGADNDTLTGGAGRDVFVFSGSANGGGGFDRIRDFENGLDRIDLSAFDFTSFIGDVQRLMSQSGDNVRLSFGDGDVLLIENSILADFDMSDFIL